MTAAPPGVRALFDRQSPNRGFNRQPLVRPLFNRGHRFEQLLIVAARYLSRPAELGRSEVELAMAVERATEALAVAR